MSMEESISLEETNKIRISLGLKPLTDDKAPADDKDKQAEDNYAKLRQKEAQEQESKQIRDRIAKVRNRRELNASLKGTTLGDADGDADDTLKWVKKNKKKEKELAKKRQEELERMDKVFQGEEYTENDLVGLKVSHDFNELGEGEDRILTLKDSRILDNEEDELQNVEMAEDERTMKKNEMKIRKRDYTGYDDDEFEPGHQGMKRAVLAKYDEDIEGTKQTDFRLGKGTTASQATPAPMDESSVLSVNKSLLSIDYAKNMETSDYLRKGDVGFKKSKTKKKRPSRRAAAADSDADDQMQVDENVVIPRARDLDANFVDDDELQAALARSRKAKLHKAKKLSPDEVVKKVAGERAREQAAANNSIKVDEDDEAGRNADGITFDDTSEFVRAITYNPVAVKPEPAEPSSTRGPSKQPSPTRDVSMEGSEVVLEELEAGELVVKDEEDEEAILNAIENALKATDAEEGVAAQSEEVGTSTEQTYNSGMASTLNILRQQGILSTPAADQNEREKTQLQRDLWLADQRRRLALREMERLQSRGSNKDQAQREYENRLREQQEARDNLEAFKNYKPDVNIVYYDEFGRTLTPKEAWKALSHTFHGKGSGKMKTEKRLKKIAEEKKQAAMASGDTPLSMNRAFQIRQEKAGQAHFVLSVGNRGAVPQAAEFLDAQPLSKGKTEKMKNKKKESAKVNQTSDTGFITLPAPQSIPHTDGSPSFSPGPGTTAGSPVTAPRPGFSRISSSTAEAPSQGGTPVPSDRTKVAFGFGAKRKAGEEMKGTPPPKKR